MRAYAEVLPVLLEADLYQAGWNGALSTYPGMTLKQKAMQSLRSSIMKKFNDGVTKAADAKALALFLDINEKCRSYCMDTSSMNEVEAIAIGEAKDFLYRFFHFDDQTQGNLRVLNLADISVRIGLGNGANIGSFGTDFFSKLATSNLSGTNSALFKLYEQTIRSLPLWSSVESTRSKFRESRIVRGSRLSFVPKTTEISRTICTEPILNMLFQKGIGSILEDRLVQICGIDLSSQPDKNRVLARLGSKDGRFGTIDLSSASDSMSLSLVHTMFPKQVFELLELCRSPITILPDGTEVTLHMISSMGNAYTFPLQTIFFSALVYGAYRVLGIPFERPFRRNLGNFAVFGDDIIVRAEAYGLVCKLLSLCGFKVNVDKSFNTGPFRESCGHDYFSDCNVRGVYIKSLKTVGDRYSAINRLLFWSAKWRIPLPRVIHFLLKGLRFLEIPLAEADDSGIKVPQCMIRKPVYSKYTGGIRYRYLSHRAQSFDVTDIESRPPRMRGWIKNPDGILMAAIAGSLRAGKIVVRSNEHYRTSLRTRYSSNWNYIPSEHAVMRGLGEEWKFFFDLNLNFYKV